MRNNDQVLPKYAAVALNLPIPELFHYSIPEEMQALVRIGIRVRVPFGYRKLIGYIVEFPEAPKMPNLKPIERLIDAAPVIDESQQPFRAEPQDQKENQNHQDQGLPGILLEPIVCLALPAIFHGCLFP